MTEILDQYLIQDVIPLIVLYLDAGEDFKIMTTRDVENWKKWYSYAIEKSNDSHSHRTTIYLESLQQRIEHSINGEPSQYNDSTTMKIEHWRSFGLLHNVYDVAIRNQVRSFYYHRGHCFARRDGDTKTWFNQYSDTHRIDGPAVVDLSSLDANDGKYYLCNVEFSYEQHQKLITGCRLPGYYITANCLPLIPPENRCKVSFRRYNGVHLRGTSDWLWGLDEEFKNSIEDKIITSKYQKVPCVLRFAFPDLLVLESYHNEKGALCFSPPLHPRIFNLGYMENSAF